MFGSLTLHCIVFISSNETLLENIVRTLISTLILLAWVPFPAFLSKYFPAHPHINWVDIILLLLDIALSIERVFPKNLHLFIFWNFRTYYFTKRVTIKISYQSLCYITSVILFHYLFSVWFNRWWSISTEKLYKLVCKSDRLYESVT